MRYPGDSGSIALFLLIIRIKVFRVGHSNGMQKIPELCLNSVYGNGEEGVAKRRIIIPDTAEDSDFVLPYHFLSVRRN